MLTKNSVKYILQPIENVHRVGHYLIYKGMCVVEFGEDPQYIYDKGGVSS